MTQTPAAEIVEELRFLADSRQQMGYDRSGAAMDCAATEIEALRAREAELLSRIDGRLKAEERLVGLGSKYCDQIIHLQRELDKAVAENQRLSRAVMSGVLGELLDEDEAQVLVDFVRSLRDGSALAPIRGEG